MKAGDRIRRVALAMSFLAAVLVLAGAAKAPADEAVDVVTVAGDGRAGIADGSGTAATFAQPSGLARAKDGSVFVSDEGGQRVRTIGRDGVVRTVAGSGSMGPLGLTVAGGFEDGPALSARFNHPAGLAVSPSGTLFIADSFNACIRKLSGAVVSTVAGKPGQPGAIDGPAPNARLKRPRGLALDSQGALYIADFGVGLRRLDADGTLSTIKFKSNGDIRAMGVSIAGTGEGTVVFVSTPDVLFVYRPASGVDEAYYAPNGSEGGGTFGAPNQLAAIDARQLLMTDMRGSNVRYIRLPALPYVTAVFSRIIAGGSSERPKLNAGSSDGARASARFMVPEGILLDGSSVLIADMGNNRIRRVRLPHIRVSETGPMPTSTYDPRSYQVAYIGQSSTFWDTLGDDSFCAVLETTMNRSGKINRPVNCHTIRIDAGQFRGIRDYVDNYLAYQHIDLVVLGMNGSLASSVAPAGGNWDAAAPLLRSELQGLLAQLQPTHAMLVLCWNYYAGDVAAAEGRYWRTMSTSASFPDDAGSAAASKPLEKAVQILAGLPLKQYDSFDDFVRYERRPHTAPLFAVDDSHLSAEGMAVLANGVASIVLSSGGVRP